MKNIILFRGLPGSGKSSLAETLCKSTFSADMFFEQNGGYDFDATKLPQAHKWCKEQVEQAMVDEVEIIGVANTFTTDWEMETYFELAEDYGYRISTVIVENRHGSTNVHGVPTEALERMKNRFSTKLI
jgi:predicted kinase